MELIEIFVFALAVFIILVWFLLRPARASSAQRAMIEGVNHAHRGLHTRDKAVPENSLPAFAAAVEHGYGMELDVQLSQDGRVMVFHDDTLDRVCGVHGRVDAFSFDALREMRLCGTKETLPLFTEVLDLVDGRTPIIVELKTGPRRVELCEKVLPLLQNYDGPTCIESFDPRIVAWFQKNAPAILRGQLSDSRKSFCAEGHPRLQAFVLGNLFSNVLARPHFIAYGPGKKSAWVKLAEAMGALRVCWTVRDTDEITAKEAENDAVIFEFYTPEPKFR